MAAATLAFPAAIEQTRAVNPWLIAITVTLAGSEHDSEVADIRTVGDPQVFCEGLKIGH